MPPERAPLLVAHHLHKTYRNGVETPVLHGVSLVLRRGEFVALVGQSGSGKTTLLNLLGALDRPTGGEVTLEGRAYHGLSEDEMADLRWHCIGFVFQFHYLLPEFTVYENARMPLLIARRPPPPDREAYVLSLLERVGLMPFRDRLVGQISGGQAQRVAVVRALVNKPSLILADEPTGNLDTVNGRVVFDIMRELNRQMGSAFMLVTHDERLAFQADRLIRIQDGRIVQDVPTRELTHPE